MKAKHRCSTCRHDEWSHVAGYEGARWCLRCEKAQPCGETQYRKKGGIPAINEKAGKA